MGVIGRILAYIALYAAVALMLGIYRPDVVTAAAMLLGATVTYLAARYGRRFEHVASAYGSLAWSGGLFLLFLLTYFVVSGEPVWASALYTIYTIIGLATVAVIGAKEYRAVMQNTRADYVLIGIGLGVAAAWLAYAVPLQVAPLIGPTTQVLSIGDFATGVFITMLYIVAIPEEFMGRVFAFHVGATTVDLFSASVAATVLGYALHAISRYPNFGVLAVVTLVWSLITAYYAFTRCLFGSVLMHAVYNTIIVLMTEFGVLPVFIPSLIVAIVIFGYVAKKVVR